MPEGKIVRILHLALDDKFIDQAFDAFEKVAPGNNEVWICGEAPLKFVRRSRVILLGKDDLASADTVRRLENFDIVVLHSLTPEWMPLVRRAPASVKLLWVGWGYDYCDLVYGAQRHVLLPVTLKLVRSSSSLVQALKGMIKNVIFRYQQAAAIRRIDFFSPVLFEEYERFVQRLGAGRVPRYARWNYGNLEDDLVRGLMGAEVGGNNVLLGNSAVASNNHADAIELLKQGDLSGRKIVTPLSYGDAAYGGQVIRIGRELLGDAFLPLTDFMPIDEYTRIIKSCGYVVMNHIRQQAVGNVVIMLYLGARVFLREESPVYRTFRRQGVILSTAQELAANPGLLSVPLTDEQRAINRKIMIEHWSRDASERRTRQLVATLLSASEQPSRK